MLRLHSARICLILLALGAHLGIPANNLSASPQEGYEILGLSEELAKKQGPHGISFQEAYARALLYLSGPTQVFQKSIGLMIDLEIERRQNAGEPLPDLDFSDEAVEAEINSRIERTAQQQPGLDFWAQVEALGYTRERYKHEVRTHMRLDGLFFPPNPEEWSPILEDIFDASAENSLYFSMVEPLKEQFAKSLEETNKPFQIDPTTMQLFLRPTVLRWMMKEYVITEPFHGLPEGIAMKVGSKEVKTVDLLKDMAAVIGPVERERAAAWVEVTWALAADLKEKDILLTPEEVLAIITEEKKEYVNSPISYEQVALQFLGFPSMQAYHQYYQLRMSFRKSLPDPYPEDILRNQLEERGHFLGDGKVEAEVILFSALNKDTRTFPKEGDPFADAEKRAAAAAKELQEGAEWNSTLMKYSDYPDTYPNANAAFPQPHFGRFGVQSRNPLRDFLGENEFMDFLFGGSVADQLFFKAQKGEVYGPVRGPLGYYIFRLNRRVDPSRTLHFTKSEVVPGQTGGVQTVKQLLASDEFKKMEGTEEEKQKKAEERLAQQIEAIVKRHVFLAGDDYLTTRFHSYIGQVLN